jgi:hypothetical protein
MKNLLSIGSIVAVSLIVFSSPMYLHARTATVKIPFHQTSDLAPKPTKPPRAGQQGGDGQKGGDVSKEETSDFSINTIKNLNKDQIANFDKEAMGGFNKDQVANFDKEAMAGFNKDQVANFDKEAMAGFNKDQVANFDKKAMGGFNKDQVANFDREAMAGFGREHVTNMTKNALSGFKVDQIEALGSKSREGIADKIDNFSEFSTDVKEALVKDETRRMPGVGWFESLAKLLKTETMDNAEGWDKSITIQEKFYGSSKKKEVIISENPEKTTTLINIFARINIFND